MVILGLVFIFLMFVLFIMFMMAWGAASAREDEPTDEKESRKD